MSRYVSRADFAATPLVPSEQAAHSGTPSTLQRVTSENATPGAFPASEQSAATSTRRATRGTTLLALSVVNFLVAAGLLIWVLIERYGDGPSSRQIVAISQQGTATPLLMLAVEVTPSHQVAPPTSTHLPPSRTATPLLPSVTATATATAASVPPTATSLPSTNIPAPPAATDTPIPTAPPPPTATTVPPTPKPRPPPPTPVREIVYIVRSGDNLIGIAARYGTTVDAIMRRNGLGSTVIYAGERLIIPLR
jgi:LysM repeat protein